MAMTEAELIDYRRSARCSVTVAVSVWMAPSDRYVISLLRHHEPPEGADTLHELCFTREVAESIRDSFRSPVHSASAEALWKSVQRIAVSPALQRDDGCDGATSTLAVEAGWNRTLYEWWFLPDGWESVDDVAQRLHRLADEASIGQRGTEALAGTAMELMYRSEEEDRRSGT